MPTSTGLTDQGHAPALSAAGVRRRRRLSRVAMLRTILPLGVAALLAVCTVQIGLHAIATAQRKVPAPQAPTMVAPRFAGSSPKGSYTITGRTGMRETGAQDRIVITDPVLTFQGEGGRPRRATAESGVFYEGGHMLLLSGNVRLNDGSGVQFTANEARIDTRTGVVSGQTGVRIEKNGAPVESESYSIESEGDRVILKGGVRGRLNPQN